MKKLLYVAFAFCVTSCSLDNDVENTFNNVVEAGTNMALDSLHKTVDKELGRHTGIDSLSARILSADTINVEREVERGVKRELIKILSE